MNAIQPTHYFWKERKKNTGQHSSKMRATPQSGTSTTRSPKPLLMEAAHRFQHSVAQQKKVLHPMQQMKQRANIYTSISAPETTTMKQPKLALSTQPPVFPSNWSRTSRLVKPSSVSTQRKCQDQMD